MLSCSRIVFTSLDWYINEESFMNYDVVSFDLK